MENLEMITACCIVMWYVIDRIKPIWAGNPYGKYITMIVSAVFAICLAYGYNLDIMAALGVAESPGILGTCVTALTYMGGSSAVAELIQRIKNK